METTENPNDPATGVVAGFTPGAQTRMWRTDELRLFLRIHLAAPVFPDLESFDPERSVGLEATLASDPYYSQIESFADLFHLAPPPIELLRLVKDYAKHQIDSPEALLPREIASVLYYASVLLAHLRCQEPLSKLNESALLRGVQWALYQPWLDTETRRLFQEGQRRLFRYDL
jgi:hypothetical protein